MSEPADPPRRSDRSVRLQAALRDNLRRRKQQARQRESASREADGPETPRATPAREEDTSR